MRIQIAVSVAAVAVVMITAGVIKRDRAEGKANAAFKESVVKGEKAYKQTCGACHTTFDPRFYVFDEWAQVLDRSGCPATRVELADSRAAMLDFFRASAAPTPEEAETVRRRERRQSSSDRVARGREAYVGTCAGCHANAFFPKTRTAREWQDAVREIGFFHSSVQKPVWVDEKTSEDLLAFLEFSSAGTPTDAWAFKALLEGGASPKKDGSIPGGAGNGAVAQVEIKWERDFEKAAALAKEKGLPLVADFTDLSGG